MTNTFLGDVDMTSLTHRCRKCGKTKSLNEFLPSAPSKRDWICKPCRNVLNSQWQKRNPEKVKAKSLRWLHAHLEEVKEQARIFRALFPEKASEAQRRYRELHPDKKRESALKARRKNPEYHNVINKQNRRAMIRGNGGKFTQQEWKDLKEFYNFTCLCCGKQEPEIKLEPDHVKPILLGGLNVIGNLQPLCRSCNSKKGAKHIDYRKDRK
jgi:5-methylcytosine-specific restriction endonuclease McrA